MLTKAIRKEFSAMLQQECLRQTEAQAKALAAIAAESRATLDGETTHLGDGVYASAAGEIWYRYQCRSVIVKGMELENCYASLPVQLQASDIRRYQDLRENKGAGEGHGASQTHPQFFLEPKTRRITTIGIPIPCTPHFKAAYRSLTQQWWMVGPRLTRIANPTDISQEYQKLEPDLPADLDFEEGGIYTAQDVRQMDLFAQTPRKVDDMARGLGAQGYRGADGHVGPHQLFPEMPDLDYRTSITSWIWVWLDRWGNVMSIIIGLGLLFKIVTWLTGLAFRVMAIHRVHGLSVRLFAACFPSALFTAMRPRPAAPTEPLQVEDQPTAPRDFAAEEAALRLRLHHLHRDRQLAYNPSAAV